MLHVADCAGGDFASTASDGTMPRYRQPQHIRLNLMKNCV
jgi:hypothetical protein